jgi:hypothetical protein
MHAAGLFLIGAAVGATALGLPMLVRIIRMEIAFRERAERAERYGARR